MHPSARKPKKGPAQPANTSESLLSSDHATDNTPSSDTTITDLGDDFDTDFVHVTTEDYTEGLKDEDSSRGTSTTTSSTGCAITFSSAFGASSSSSSEFEHIESIWGWDATRGSCAAGAPSTPPKAKAEKIDGEEGGNDTPPLLGDALALVAEAEASAAADLNRSVPRPRQARAARKKLPTLDTPIVYPLGEMKHSFRNVYRKLRQNERRMKKVQRKLHIYKAEIEYLKGKRRRIWNML
ncbi:uncharacterized protein LAJ45_10131 [Morchella importuna]|uniref:uncharacterized protein n=1 Tax=Morchella importuna TaxID=1174673 RepID=UPI001E8DAEE0|nr:uncharacterized protein LAJ45_10131 [Morchella importuna]KAH8145808.1 hypothetical protein LAJ45_10131 [Morchella importuna]